VWALTSAGTVAATILCCLPFATGIIGASVAAVGARFVPLQPYLIAVSLMERRHSVGCILILRNGGAMGRRADESHSMGSDDRCRTRNLATGLRATVRSFGKVTSAPPLHILFLPGCE